MPGNSASPGLGKDDALTVAADEDGARSVFCDGDLGGAEGVISSLQLV